MEFGNYALPLTWLLVLSLFIIADVISGYLKGWLKKEINSTIGINGLIRKAGIVLAALTFVIFDLLTGFNFIGWLPNDLITVLNLTASKLGMAEIVIGAFALMEAVSLIENLGAIGAPLPKFITDRIHKLKSQVEGE